jgi:hypothetical protein
MKYYGVRYAKNCHPAELFVTYFTSSKYVADYIKKHGLPDIIEVRKTFTEKDRVKKALLHEHRTLKKLKVIHRSDYLNKTDNYAIAPENRGRCPLDMTIYTFIHKSGIIENTTRHHMIEKYKLITSKLSELINGNRHRHGGWRMTWSLSDEEMKANKEYHHKKLVEINRSDESRANKVKAQNKPELKALRSSSDYMTLYRFVNIDGSTEYLTRSDMLEKYPEIDKSALLRVVRGDNKSHMGWSIAKE